MKKLITAGAMLLSLSSFAQSYMVLQNGVTLTTDKAGFIYDFGNFILPYKVTVNGGQYLVEDDKLETIDQAGFLYQKDLKVKKVSGKGLNYLVTSDNSLVTIDSKGFYYKFDKESALAKRINTYGGNFFVAAGANKKSPSELYTVNTNGNYIKVDVAGLNTSNITAVGGTYFQMTNGLVYTVTKDGFVFAKNEVKVGMIVKKGGNYFIDATNKLFTVSEDGFLILPVLPANIKVNTLTKFGSNYMIDSTGKVFVVDNKGVILERTINHDLLNAAVLSL